MAIIQIKNLYDAFRQPFKPNTSQTTTTTTSSNIRNFLQTSDNSSSNNNNNNNNTITNNTDNDIEEEVEDANVIEKHRFGIDVLNVGFVVVEKLVTVFKIEKDDKLPPNWIKK